MRSSSEPAPRSPARVALRVVVAAALLAGAAALLYRDRDALPRLLALPVWLVGLVVTGRVAGHLARHLSAAVALRSFVPALRFGDYLALASAVGLAGRLLPLGGGLVVKAVALERAYAVRKVELAAAFGAALALRLVAAALVAALGLGLLGATGSAVHPSLWLLAAASLAAGLLPFVWRAPLRLAARHLALAGRLELGVEQLSKEPRRLAAMFALELSRTALVFACAGALLWALAPGHPFASLAGGVMHTLTALVRVVPLTPGHAGTHEWMAALVGAGAGVELSLGLLATVVGRVLGLLAGVIVAGVAYLVRGDRGRATAAAD